MRFLLLLCVLLGAANAKGQTGGCGRLYVDSAVAVSGNGGSWATAFKTVSQALDSANRGSCSSREIWVAKGTYFPMTGAAVAATGRDSSFRVFRNGLKVYGGFTGGETLLSQRNVAGNPTLLSGDIGVAGDSTDNCYHVVTVVGSNNIDTTTRIDGFSIVNGNASEPSVAAPPFYIGQQTLFRGGGGGLYVLYSSPTVVNCTFSRNTASLKGAGMYNIQQANPTVANCTFTFNSGYNGGGMYNSGSSPRVSNCTFKYNIGSRGIGMYNTGSSPTVTNCDFSYNTGEGGGICNETASSSTITNCTFTHNNATIGTAGGIFNLSSSPIITNCTIANNSAYHAGGMSNYNSTPRITNCLFAANSSIGEGGGMANGTSGSIITNCTFWGNTSGTQGGGIYNITAALTLKNCIFWGNISNGGGGSFYNATTITPVVTHTLSEAPIPGFSNSTANPIFVNSANPIGTDGIWGTADDGLRLATCSPAINTGNNAAIPAGVTTDITGVARIQSTAVDRGAYEMPATAVGGSVTTVSMVPGNPVCSNGVVTFTATAFNPGTVPVYQWYKNGVAVGTNAATYTASSWSSGDSVWVVHTNNNCSANDTSTKTYVQITAVPAQPGTITGSTTPCQGTQTYSIAPVAGSTSYTWTVPAGWVITGGQGTIFLDVTNTIAAGTVSVTANNACAVASPPRTLAVAPLPPVLATPSVPVGPVAVCASSSTTYTTTAVPGGLIYAWAVPAGWVITSGQGTLSITVTAAAGNSSGIISVLVGNNCQLNSLPATLAVTGGAVAPTVAISKNTGDTICAGTLVTFTATATIAGTAPIYQWKANGGAVGTNSPTYSNATLTSGDVISVVLTSNAACASVSTVTSANTVLTVNPNVVPLLTVTANPGLSLPAGSTVTFIANVTPTGPVPTYQWLKNGIAIAGATGSTYTTSTLQGGDLISVQVADLGPCANPNNLTSVPLRISDPAGIQTVSSGGNWPESLLLHPNPNTGRFMISADWGTLSAGEKVQVEVVNNLGQSVFSKEVVLTAGKWRLEVQLNEGVANGLYMLRINRQKDGSMATKPVLIQR